MPLGGGRQIWAVADRGSVCSVWLSGDRAQGGEENGPFSFTCRLLFSTSSCQVSALLTSGDIPVLCGLQQGPTEGRF